MATFDNQLTDIFTTTSTVSKSQLTPWSFRRTANTVRTTVTTTMRVIDSVHGNTTNRWTNTFTAITTGRTDFDVLVLDVADDTDSCVRFHAETTNFTRWHTHLCIVAFFGHKLRFGTS